MKAEEARALNKNNYPVKSHIEYLYSLIRAAAVNNSHLYIDEFPYRHWNEDEDDVIVKEVIKQLRDNGFIVDCRISYSKITYFDGIGLRITW